LTGEEQKRFGIKETDNLEAYDALLKGKEYEVQRTPDGFAKALSYYQLATEFDPNYSRAHARLAHLYILSSSTLFPLKWREKMGVTLDRARLLARKHLKIALRKPTATAYVVASTKPQEALEFVEKSMRLNPQDMSGHKMWLDLPNLAGR
jgi:tetratricopeptide (TPR) repeat protein